MGLATRTSRRAGAALALAVLVTACGDNSTAPTTISDPLATIGDLTAVDSAFGSDAYEGLALLASIFPAPTAPVPLQGIAAALHMTLPPAPGAATAGALGRGAAPQDLRALLGLSSPALAPVLPDTLLGKTFEYNADSGKYVATARTGAPASGITFILYKESLVPGQPDPNAEVGSLDIIDGNPATGAQLRFVVRGMGGSPTFLDHTLTYIPGNQSGTVQASGYVSNGRAGSLERRFTFDGALNSTALPNGLSQSTDFTYDVNVPDVTVELHLASTEDTVKDTSVLGIDYRFTRRLENIRLLGADTITNTGSTENATFGVTVNDNAYATLTVVNGAGTVRDHTGAIVPVNGNDQQYEDEVLIALIFGVFDATVRFAEVLAIPALLLGFVTISLV
jgi:hypothetical protein